MASRHMYPKVQWHQIDGNEWFFVGERNDFRTVEVQVRLHDFFGGGEEVFVVIDRRHAYPVKTSHAAEVVGRTLEDRDVTLVSTDFTRFFHFSHIGVARHGVVS